MWGWVILPVISSVGAVASYFKGGRDSLAEAYKPVPSQLQTRSQLIQWGQFALIALGGLWIFKKRKKILKALT